MIIKCFNSTSNDLLFFKKYKYCICFKPFRFEKEPEDRHQPSKRNKTSTPYDKLFTNDLLRFKIIYDDKIVYTYQQYDIKYLKKYYTKDQLIEQELWIRNIKKIIKKSETIYFNFEKIEIFPIKLVKENIDVLKSIAFKEKQNKILKKILS